MKKNESNFGIVLYESQCSNNCVFCESKKLGNIELNIKKELQKIDAELKKGRRIDKIEISGQDPGEFEGLPEFVAAIKAKTGASRISLFTHGKKLSDNDYLQKLIKSGINHFVIPLYGHNSKVHDSVTKTAGSFTMTMEGVENILRSGQGVSFQSLITRENQSHLKDFFFFLSTLKFSDFCRVGVPYYKYSKKKFRSSLPDFVKLKKQLPSALRYCQSIDFDLQLFDVPKCLIGFDYQNITENGMPTRAYKNVKEDGDDSYRVVKQEVVPDYRTKGKSILCRQCVFNDACPGVYLTYVKSKLFPFDPVNFKKNGKT